MVNKVGRPAKYSTIKKLQIKINKYFKNEVGINIEKDKNGVVLKDIDGKVIYSVRPPTVAGLSLYLGFCNRSSMYDYKDKKQGETGKEFSNTIKKAITRIEQFAEEQLYAGKPTGAIFWLKNHGWMDIPKDDDPNKQNWTQTQTIYGMDKNAI